jgi:hypothetical protein
LVTAKVPTEILRELALAVEKFYNSEQNHKSLFFDNECSPLQIGAAVGSISIYKYILERIGLLNPEDMNPSTPFYTWTPLHFAAEHGHCQVHC